MLYSLLKSLRNSLLVCLCLSAFVYADQYIPITDATSTANADVINRSFNSLYNTKLDLNPKNVIPITSNLYALGNSNYRWLAIYTSSVIFGDGTTQTTAASSWNFTSAGSNSDFSTNSAAYVYVTGSSATIIPSSASSKIKVSFCGQLHGGAAGNNITLAFFRNGANDTPHSASAAIYFPNAIANELPVSFFYVSSPGSIAAQTYDLRLAISAGSTVTLGDGTSFSFLVEELK